MFAQSGSACTKGNKHLLSTAEFLAEIFEFKNFRIFKCDYSSVPRAAHEQMSCTDRQAAAERVAERVADSPFKQRAHLAEHGLRP